MQYRPHPRYHLILQGKLKKLLRIVSLSSTLVLCAYQVAKAQVQATGGELSPENFSSEISKEIAKVAGNSQRIKEIITPFVNSSKAPLACKMSIFPLFDITLNFESNIQEYKLQLEQQQIKGPQLSELLSKGRAVQGKTIAAKLLIADMFCPAK